MTQMLSQLLRSSCLWYRGLPLLYIDEGEVISRLERVGGKPPYALIPVIAETQC